MLAMNCHGVPVVVDRDRVHGGSYAISKLGADVLLLDDGFQYLRLKHRHDIALVDSTAPWGTGRLLPRGTLREPPKSLRRASYIFLTKSEGGNEEMIAQIRKFNPVADIIECRHRALHLQHVHTGEILPLSELRGREVSAFSGIAVPQSFEKLLRRLGARVKCTEHFNDHHRFKQKEVDAFIERSLKLDVQMVVTTEKDFVRLPPVTNRDVPFYFLRVDIEIIRGQEIFERMISLIAEPRRFAEL
jgi:tetraacyldisaccharide 4'-kinase